MAYWREDTPYDRKKHLNIKNKNYMNGYILMKIKRLCTHQVANKRVNTKIKH